MRKPCNPHPDVTLPGVDWWIVESEPLGRTAMPGRVLAFQGAEVLKAAPHWNKVHIVRRAIPGDVGDALAIKQSREEIAQVHAACQAAAGALKLSRGAQRG